jgi:hypothetical protein
MQAPCGPCGGWEVEMYGDGTIKRLKNVKLVVIECDKKDVWGMNY